MGQAGSAMSLFTVTVTCQSNELYTAEHLSHAMHYSPLTAAVWHTPVSRQFRWQPRDRSAAMNAAVFQVDVLFNKGLWICNVTAWKKTAHTYTTHIIKGDSFFFILCFY